ncbi:hypothetical protein ACHAXR_002954, partial [Thalassiosira sp. AJA248-18]
MRRLLCILLATAHLTSSIADDGIYLRAHKNTDHQPAAPVPEQMATIQREELAATQTLLSDYDFTRTLRDALQSQSARNLVEDDDDTCLPSQASCSDHTSNCCQGGCSSQNKCICQLNNRVCFNSGSPDLFCCSNKCGTNGRCQCIEEGESCAVGDGFCCDGLTCGSDGMCISENGAAAVQTPNPTKTPTKMPVSTSSSQGGWGEEFSTNCQGTHRVCFNSGQYDMFCCSKRCGSNGRCEAPTPTNEPTKDPTKTPTKNPTKTPTKNPTKTPTAVSPVFTSKTGPSAGGLCNDSNKIKITFEIETDQFGGDTGWSITKQSNGGNIFNVPNGTYGYFTYDTVDMCVSPGIYNFTITDRYGDGICCAYGEGYVKIYLDDREVMNVKSYGKVMSELLNVGYDPNPVMTERDYLYLDAHNSRRMNWHTENNVSYVPLIYSPILAEESRVWAEKLLVNCSSADIEHEAKVSEGENLAKNIGSVNAQGGGWGQVSVCVCVSILLQSNIVGRWVEFEIGRLYPYNAHLTQALWRPSKYLGCGEAEKPFRTGMCRVQVCRYARAGNCEMGRFNSTVGKNWLPPMLVDTSR